MRVDKMVVNEMGSRLHGNKGHEHHSTNNKAELSRSVAYDYLSHIMTKPVFGMFA